MDQFDALVFHTFGISNVAPILPRQPFQRYVMFNMESPLMYPMNINYNGFFNWTMTYRLDSDFALFYGWFKSLKMDNPYPLSNSNQYSLAYPSGNGKSILIFVLGL